MIVHYGCCRGLRERLGQLALALIRCEAMLVELGQVESKLLSAEQALALGVPVLRPTADQVDRLLALERERLLRHAGKRHGEVQVLAVDAPQRTAHPGVQLLVGELGGEYA